MRFLKIFSCRFPVLFRLYFLWLGVGSLVLILFRLDVLSRGLAFHSVFFLYCFELVTIVAVLNMMELPHLAPYYRSMILFPNPVRDRDFVFSVVSTSAVWVLSVLAFGLAMKFSDMLDFLFMTLFSVVLITIRPFFGKIVLPSNWALMFCVFVTQVGLAILNRFDLGLEHPGYALLMFFGFMLAIAIPVRAVFFRKWDCFEEGYNRILEKGDSCTMWMREWYSFEE